MPYKHCGDAADFQSAERGSIPRCGSKLKGKMRKNNGEKTHRNQLRAMATESLGGQCVHCLNDGVITTEDLDFDHIDPSTKINNITRLLSYSFTSPRFWAEVAKCQLLCRPHHKAKTKLEGSYSINSVAQVGTLNSQSRLRELDVKYIRGLSALGHSQKAIAEEFGVHRATIYLIMSNKTWRHVL